MASGQQRNLSIIERGRKSSTNQQLSTFTAVRRGIRLCLTVINRLRWIAGKNKRTASAGGDRVALILHDDRYI